MIALLNKKTKRRRAIPFSAAKSRQNTFCLSNLIGFDKMPSGWKIHQGQRLTGSGYFLAEELFNKWKTKIRETIIAAGQSHVKRQGRGVSLQINHTDLRRLNEYFRNTRAKGTAEIRENVQGFLGFLAPKFFSVDTSDHSYDYSGGELANILGKEGIFNGLNDSDLESLNDFIPQYVSQIPLTLKSNKKLKVIFDLVGAGQQVYLKRIIEEFEKRLHAKIQDENRWQEFLRKYILIFRNSYGEVLEKGERDAFRQIS